MTLNIQSKVIICKKYYNFVHGLINLVPIIYIICKTNFLIEKSSLIRFEKTRYNSIIMNESKNGGDLSPYWITGFADAESSFVIRVTNNRKGRKDSWYFFPIFSIELHIRDLFVPPPLGDE